MEIIEQAPVIVTVSALVDALGGLESASEQLGASKGSVRMWIDRKAIPPRLYLRHTALLEQRGLRADPQIWKQEAAAV